MRRLKRLLLFVLVLVILTFALAGTAVAGIGPINANNGVVDTNWGAPFGQGTLNPGSPYDIVNFWVNTDVPLNPTRFYFGVETSGSIATNSGNNVLVSLDCTNPPNGQYDDSEDIEVRHYAVVVPDYIVVKQGDPAAFDVLTSAESEYFQIPSSAHNMAELSPPVGINVEWSACFASNPVIRARIMKFSGEVLDETVPVALNLPTSVKISRLSAQAKNTDFLFSSVGILVVMAVVGIMLRRRRTVGTVGRKQSIGEGGA